MTSIEQLEDAISRVRNIPYTPWIELRDGDEEACKIVALALTERLEREQEEPKPLSLEELRERDGKPVWVEEYKEWAVVEVDAIGRFKDMPFALGKNYNHDINARGLTCYDRQLRKEANQ